MASVTMTDVIEDEKSWKESQELIKWRQIDLNIKDAPKDHSGCLPIEIIQFVFEYLDPVEATCLGLAGRPFYPMYKIMHKVPLLLDTPWRRGLAGKPTTLHGFLEGWAGKQRCKLFHKYSASGPPRLIFDKLPREDDKEDLAA